MPRLGRKANSGCYKLLGPDRGLGKRLGLWLVNGVFSHFSHGEALKNLKLDSSSGESLTVQCRYMRKFCGDVKPFLIFLMQCKPKSPAIFLDPRCLGIFKHTQYRAELRNELACRHWASGMSCNWCFLQWDPQVTVGFNRKECSKNLDDFGYPKILGHLHRSDSRIENIVIMW